MNTLCGGVFCAILLLRSATAAESGLKVIDDPEYTHAQRLVEVEPGRRLNLYCLGEGTPTVIFEAGSGDNNSEWARVQPAIAAHTRACSYDRAGIGFSDPARRLSDSANAVDDLHRLLNAATIKPPYVLVGHSLGGMHVRLYADLHFDEIAGMVLIDSVDEAWDEKAWQLDPQQRTHEQYFAWGPKARERHRACIDAAQTGFVKGSPIYDTCVYPDDPLYSEAINAANAKNQMSVAYQQEDASDSNSRDASAAQVIAARRWYGELPLIVLTRSPDKPRANETQAHRDALNRLHAVFADQLAALSKRGVVRPVPDSTHEIQKSQPQEVIDAILKVLEDARERKEAVGPVPSR
ncbi:MAG TPA: alpha/beta hydrolase [Rhodanobacteraceae bacterium]|nr:alpha/beta hydrolase [Rhodanobacteraceae bacterium]